MPQSRCQKWRRFLFIIFILLSSIYVLGVTMTDYTNPSDISAVIQVKALEIKPNTPYYHTTPIPNSFNRYKNFPHQAPLSVEIAENEWPGSLYYGVVVAEVGNNYQYHIIHSRSRLSINVLMPQNLFKELENGTYFFSLDRDQTLHQLDGAQQALQLNNYLRVVKEMGKVILIEKRPLIQDIKMTYEYWPNGNLKYSKSESFDINQKIITTIETTCKEDGERISIIKKNSEGQIIKSYISLKENSIYGIEEIFNDKGIKTNHIITMENGDITNQHLDEDGQVEFITNVDYVDQQLPDFEEDEPYKSLQIDPSK